VTFGSDVIDILVFQVNVLAGVQQAVPEWLEKEGKRSLPTSGDYELLVGNHMLEVFT